MIFIDNKKTSFIDDSKSGGIFFILSDEILCKFLVLQETLYFFKRTMCQRKCILFLIIFSILPTNCYTARFLLNDLKRMKSLARYTRHCKTVSLFAIVMNGTRDSFHGAYASFEETDCFSGFTKAWRNNIGF